MRGRVKLSRSRGGNALVFIFLAVMGLFTALPFIYAVAQSFKPLSELFIYPPEFFPRNPTLDNYLDLFRMQFGTLIPMERYIFNSVFVSVLVTAGYVLTGTLAAYPLAKGSFPGKSLILGLVVYAILFRPEVTQIPSYFVISKLGLINTYGAIILPAMAGSFGVFLMRQFMTVIPDTVIEAAKIDGAGEMRVFFSIALPMVKPAWLTLVIFTFQGIWNTTGVQYIYSENLKLLPTALSQIVATGLSRAGVSSAITVILLIPPVLIFIVSQSSVMETMSHSGMKG